MNIPLIVLLIINYWYSIHFTYFCCSYTKNIMKYLSTSSRSLIEGNVSLTSTKDQQEILMRENIIYPLNSQPKFHNIQRGARCLGSSIITTNRQIFRLKQKNGLCQANFDLMDFWALPGDFWSPNEIVSYETYIIFEKHLGAMLFAQNISKIINTSWSVEA